VHLPETSPWSCGRPSRGPRPPAAGVSGVGRGKRGGLWAGSTIPKPACGLVPLSMEPLSEAVGNEPELARTDTGKVRERRRWWTLRVLPAPRTGSPSTGNAEPGLRRRRRYRVRLAPAALGGPVDPSPPRLLLCCYYRFPLLWREMSSGGGVKNPPGGPTNPANYDDRAFYSWGDLLGYVGGVGFEKLKNCLPANGVFLAVRRLTQLGPRALGPSGLLGKNSREDLRTR